MYYELALISVVIGGGYWGWHFVRHESLRVYGALNLIAALLAGLGFYGQRADVASLGIPGAIGAGAGACLLVLGPLARALARRAAAAERFGLSQRLLDVADVLAPGSGVGDEKALLAAMREIRDGNIEQTVGALEAARRTATPEARLAIDERIAMLYLASYRWDEAIAHAEEHLFGAVPPATDAPPHPALAVRRALGLAPAVWVELLGAYGYKGDLEQAARMLARLEEVCADRPEAAMWLHRGRLIFLAFAGRTEAVQRLVQPRRSRYMKPAARTYWVAVAHEHHGEVAAAEAAYHKARARSRGRPRILIDQALARVSAARPVELGPIAADIAAQVEAAPPPAVTALRRPRGPVATRVLVLAMIAVAAVIAIVLGASSDVGVLVRSGALVRGLVHDGEWWRIVSANFVHVGGIHLVINVVGLWFLGRLAEELFDGWRTIAIFALAGLTGFVASFYASPAGISAGASAGVFGLLGAVFVELTWQRRRRRAEWTRGVWGLLVVITIAETGIGFLYSVTDQWAHLGGLAGGALAGLLLSPQARWQATARRVGQVIGVAFVVAAIVAAALVLRTSVADSLARKSLAPRSTATVSVVVPVGWLRSQDELFDPDFYIVLHAQRVQVRGTLVSTLTEFSAGEAARAKDKEFERVEVATEPLVPLPAGWEGSELAIAIRDPLGAWQNFRVVVAGRSDGDHVILASLYVPETIARGAPRFFENLLGSVRQVADAP